MLTAGPLVIADCLPVRGKLFVLQCQLAVRGDSLPVCRKFLSASVLVSHSRCRTVYTNRSVDCVGGIRLVLAQFSKQQPRDGPLWCGLAKLFPKLPFQFGHWFAIKIVPFISFACLTGGAVTVVQVSIFKPFIY